MQVYNEVIERMQTLEPEHIELINESMNHAGYFEGKESHFKLTVVSDAFTGKRLVARHQLIYQLTNELMTAQGGTIHALAIHAYTPEEWQQLQQDNQGVPASPQCAGQNKP
ncbi:BolA family protein [Psychrobacter sp. FDAARGOS_221]|uniref:BolA family protein n=1 Tax=Psychrobacter sp. FDAARGOS_221 TaxID=1975705 RepID=UPI000BB59447|nr:BolA family protein [Psychrobacter sp. FDAARGOS_221]PNK60529.1 BolA family transcriptional regulator [Psychrobacter sp. FDAARGOS_221]